ncbi:MAG: hypothetical protein K8S56_04695 [Candidatus Cloacimonetes bacterium]|nr:hypothetical protein [Candidatus Cloacimonadota bacterium]
MVRKKKEIESNTLTKTLVSLLFDLLKQVLKNFEQNRSMKKMEKVQDEFATLEHLVVKLEQKIGENHKQINSLKTGLLWLSVSSVTLLSAILIQLMIYIY